MDGITKEQEEVLLNCLDDWKGDRSNLEKAINKVEDISGNKIYNILRNYFKEQRSQEASTLLHSECGKLKLLFPQFSSVYIIEQLKKHNFYKERFLIVLHKLTKKIEVQRKKQKAKDSEVFIVSSSSDESCSFYPPLNSFPKPLKSPVKQSRKKNNAEIRNGSSKYGSNIFLRDFKEPSTSFEIIDPNVEDSYIEKNAKSDLTPNNYKSEFDFEFNLKENIREINNKTGFPENLVDNILNFNNNISQNDSNDGLNHGKLYSTEKLLKNNENEPEIKSEYSLNDSEINTNISVDTMNIAKRMKIHHNSSESEEERYVPPTELLTPLPFDPFIHSQPCCSYADPLSNNFSVNKRPFMGEYRSSTNRYSSDSEQEDQLNQVSHIPTVKRLKTNLNQNSTITYDLIGNVKSLVPNASIEVIEDICRELDINVSVRPSVTDFKLIIRRVKARMSWLISAMKDEPEEHDIQTVTSVKSNSNILINIKLSRDESVQSVNIKQESVDIQNDSVNIKPELNTTIHQEEELPEISEEATPLYYHLLEIFSDICPKYLKNLCKFKEKTQETVEELINQILSNENYPKRKLEAEEEPEIDSEEQLKMLKQLLPEADPNFLQEKIEEFTGDNKKLEFFISNALEMKNYPTIKDSQRREKLSAQVKQYTENFDVKNFLDIFPNPHNYFSQLKLPLTKYSDDSSFVLKVLRNRFSMLPVRLINDVYAKEKYNLKQTWKMLLSMEKNKVNFMATKRKPVIASSENIPLLQLTAYLLHSEEIKNELCNQMKEKKAEIIRCKQMKLMKQCNCCYDDEILPQNIIQCPNKCEFCNSCVEKSVEIGFGDGKIDFPCLLHCGQFFDVQTLQNVLKPNLFSKVAKKKQVQEIKAAGIEDLESCPFCDFATIPAQGDKIFRCLDPDCMKESCRNCKEPSHVPYSCDEIERADEVRKRTFIENKMTEALLRTCYKCGLKFYKEEGCNKMTCTCGAMMCYICKNPVKDYKHFNGQGGDQYHLCPLFSDTNKMHATEILKIADEAKKEIGVNETQLKHDPTKDIAKHYKERAKKVPQMIHFQNDHQNIQRFEDRHIQH